MVGPASNTKSTNSCSTASVLFTTFQKKFTNDESSENRVVFGVLHGCRLHLPKPPSRDEAGQQTQAYNCRPNGLNTSINLNELAAAVKQQPNFGGEEVTINIPRRPNQSVKQYANASKLTCNAEMQQKNWQRDRQRQKECGNKNLDVKDATF